MTGSAIRTSDALGNAYRVTFQEYADKLNTVQRMIDGGLDRGDAELESAMLAVEAARIAHNSARDRLARDLMRRAASVPGGDQQIRRAARLIWELAGRPEGTAERDWQKAEKLLQVACC